MRLYLRYEQKDRSIDGAGISTSAGIPDFRGPDGVWTKHPEQTKVYDIEAFLCHEEDRKYSWRWQKESPVWTAQPGTAHKALVKLEQAGMLTLLATQNFDALHEKAGNSSDVIVNLHGTIGTSHCMKCHAKYDTADIMANLDNEPDPHCHRILPYSGNMPCNGLIKTDVVYFGEALPDGAIEKSYRLATQADELWVIGSTLEVMPAASIVPIAAEAGVPITIMNMGRTQYDRLANGLSTTISPSPCHSSSTKPSPPSSKPHSKYVFSYVLQYRHKSLELHRFWLVVTKIRIFQRQKSE